MDVRQTDTGRSHPDQDLARPGLGDRHLLDGEAAPSVVSLPASIVATSAVLPRPRTTAWRAWTE
ncbi:hypothetical protein AB0N09_39890 [Streptomyces erythrochromogenes]|uniref:hypothetical protein n=1 Tax=Streptomyces erythrochromogenes TaxID=285574 RepID=UPI003427BD43